MPRPDRVWPRRVELHRGIALLDHRHGHFRRLIRINRNLGFFTNGYNYFIQIIPALIIAPMSDKEIP